MSKTYEAELITGFGLVCQDLTEIDQYKQSIEEIKAQTDSLLKQLLSKDYIMKMNNGEIEPVFSSTTSTCLTSTLVELSLYTTLNSVSDIVQNLRYYFQNVDKLIVNYPLLTKVIVIGDTYIAVGGLFGSEQDAKTAAFQIISLSNDIARLDDEINVQLSSNFQSRIGVFSGGYLIAGLRNENQMKFEVFGKTLFYSRMLEETGKIHQAHLSESCYNLVAEGPWEFSNGDDLELQGLGMIKTYYTSFESQEDKFNDDWTDSNRPLVLNDFGNQIITLHGKNSK